MDDPLETAPKRTDDFIALHDGNRWTKNTGQLKVNWDTPSLQSLSNSTSPNHQTL